MPPYDGIDAPGEGLRIETPLHAVYGRYVVDGTVRFELIEKPQPLLGE